MVLTQFPWLATNNYYFDMSSYDQKLRSTGTRTASKPKKLESPRTFKTPQQGSIFWNS